MTKKTFYFVKFFFLLIRLHFVLLVELPKLFDLVFKTTDRRLDQKRGTLLEWILDLGDGTVKKVCSQKNSQRYTAVIITLLYLVKVYKIEFMSEWESSLISPDFCMERKMVKIQHGVRSIGRASDFKPSHFVKKHLIFLILRPKPYAKAFCHLFFDNFFLPTSSLRRVKHDND